MVKEKKETIFSYVAILWWRAFLNELIDKRGGKERLLPVPEEKQANSMVFIKLKIVPGLKVEDVLETLESVGFVISKHELSTFFRKLGNWYYRNCQDCVPDNCIKGWQPKYRPPEQPFKSLYNKKTGR